MMYMYINDCVYNTLYEQVEVLYHVQYMYDTNFDTFLLRDEYLFCKASIGNIKVV